jgi:hypothetical protein
LEISLPREPLQVGTCGIVVGLAVTLVGAVAITLFVRLC